MVVTWCCTVFEEHNYCNFLLYLTTKHIYENFGEGNFPVAHPLVASLVLHATNSVIGNNCAWRNLYEID